MEKKCIGIDVGGTTVKIGIFETDGTLVYKWEVPSRKEENGAYILPDVAASIRKKLNERGIPMDAVIGAGMGFPGPVQPDGYVEVCVNLGWRDLNPQKILSELLDGMPVRSGNDANVAALGEMWQGAAKGCRDVIMVTLGTGVGGGIIVDGKVVAGFDGAGGEIGHITVNAHEKEQCNCGQYGCLEQYASATGVVRVAKRTLEKASEDTALRKHADLTAKDVFDEAKAGDKVALEVVDEVCGILGAALSNIACVVNPEVIVIGGGVSKAGDILTDAVKKHFVATSFHACANTKFVLAGLGNDAGMYGCVEMLLD